MNCTEVGMNMTARIIFIILFDNIKHEYKKLRTICTRWRDMAESPECLRMLSDMPLHRLSFNIVTNNEEYKKKIANSGLEYINSRYVVTEQFVRYFDFQSQHLSHVVLYVKLPESFLLEFANILPWALVCKYQ